MKAVICMKKWFENFWYYYKWPTIVIGIILLCVLVGISSTNHTTEPDLQLLVIGEKSGNTEVGTEKMSEAVKDIISDQNGDGEIRLAYRELKMTGEQENDVSMLYHLVADFSAGESLVYLAEEEYLHHFTDQEVLRSLEGLVPEGTDGFFDSEGTLLAVKPNMEILDKMGLYVTEDIYLALRVGTEDNKNAEALFMALLK